jgi:hypothetical protein
MLLFGSGFMVLGYWSMLSDCLLMSRLASSPATIGQISSMQQL